jgi:hypothetical protein
MTDNAMVSIFQEMERDRAKAEAKAREMIQILMFRLKLARHETVHISFYGGGDSGSIEEVIVDGDIYNGDLDEEIQDWAHKLLEGTGVDWYNNDGGHGNIEIDVINWRYSYQVNQYEQVSNLAAEGEGVVEPVKGNGEDPEGGGIT